LTFLAGPRVIVVDASVAVSLLRAEPNLVARWQSWIETGALVLVPAHFGLEVANALLRGTTIRSAAQAIALIRDLFAVGLEVADRGLRGLDGALRLAERHGLTVYDAAYLDLALDVDAELATLDRELARAAAAEGVAVTG
jgi:predicted nucleic acid-binding protein